MPSGSPPERAAAPAWPAADPRPHAPRVSCLMGTYGHERYIERALDALLAQDYPADALEIVVVDDGSPDRTPELVAPYRDRIRYIRKANAGRGAAIPRPPPPLPQGDRGAPRPGDRGAGGVARGFRGVLARRRGVAALHDPPSGRAARAPPRGGSLLRRHGGDRRRGPHDRA